MSFYTDEVSIDNSNPIELYIFSYDGVDYTYTSHAYSVTAYLEGKYFTFFPDFIQRGDSLKLGDSGGSMETCTIKMSRTNSVALLYKGSPPELDSVSVRVYRVHGPNNSNHSLILRGNVSQVSFTDSTATLTITIESVLRRAVPRCTLSYFCQNCIYDGRCKLNKDDYKLHCFIDGGVNGLKFFSTNLNERESGYFTGGYVVVGHSIRSVVEHKSDWILLKYPLPLSDRNVGQFDIYPGCDGNFVTCAKKYHNTDNFSGIPYIKPYDVFKHPVTNDVAYWVNGNIVDRDTQGHLWS